MPITNLNNGDARRRYVAPRLTLYGDVAKLTATGSKSGVENSGNKDGKN